MEVRRSTFVTVVAWIFIIQSAFSSIVLLLEGILFAVVFNKQSIAENLPPNTPPIAGAVLHAMVYFVFVLFLVALFALASSVGLLQRKNWARLSFVGLLGFGIFWIVLNIIFQLIAVLAGPVPHAPHAHEAYSIMTLFAIFMGLFGVAMIVLFVWIIWRLTTDPIRQEFLPQGAVQM